MATTINGNPSAMHPHYRKMTWKRALKIERIARLSADPAGFTNEQIANILGCDKQTIVYIRQLPEYHAKMLEVATGVVSHYDQQLRENVDNIKDELRSMLPGSMMVIRNALHGKLGSQLQFKAAQEVLDREGTIAKVSKTSVSVEVKPSLIVTPEIRTNLMDLLASAPRLDAPNSGLASDFTLNSQASLDQEKDLAEKNNAKSLENLDLSSQTPN